MAQVAGIGVDQVGDRVLIDVREDDEWAEGHAPQAIHIRLQTVPERLAEIPADRDVAVICASGGRSARATDYLQQQGYDRVVNVDGGMHAWESAGYPVTR